MKRLALLFAFLASSVLADGTDSKNVAGVADAFFASYLKFLDKGAGGYEETIKWVDKSAVPTPEYKAALAKLYRDALKENPELGYGADAVIYGQDWPDKGYKATRIWLDGSRAFVQMTSRGNEEAGMVIPTRFVKIGHAWRLDGTGPLSGGAFTGTEKQTDTQLSEKLVGEWKEGAATTSFLKGGKWSSEGGVGTWKIKNGILLRSTSEAKNQPSPIYVLNDTLFIFDDDEGGAHRWERVVPHQP